MSLQLGFDCNAKCEVAGGSETFFYAQAFVGSMIRTLNTPTQKIGFRIVTR
jgi:hypothetical protein